MDPAVLDSDASLDYRSPLEDAASDRPPALTEAVATEAGAAPTTLTQIRGETATVRAPFHTNGKGGALALPYPDVLPLPPIEEPRERVHSAAARATKRAFDLIGAILLLVLLAPFWLVIALAIKLDTPGPVLFRQRRIGHDGESFRMFKFRTMIDGADEQKATLLHLNQAADGLFKINGDPRITKVGGWLRSTSLDELPQLLNVVLGRMSLVGPRPLVPEEDATIIGADRRRLAMRPGMTGVWQVGGASTVPIREMVVLDRGYLEEWSLWLDIKVLAKTAVLVALRHGL
jgi:lipopolysaccharide/colanic/teichoic acid biosynthesis glycosyltransferase